MGMAQAAGAIVLCAAVLLLCRPFAVHAERETALSVASAGGGWPGRSRSRRDSCALCAEWGLCQAPPPSRYAEVARLGLDTGRDGRPDGVGRQSVLRRHLSVHYRRHALGRIGHRRADRDVAYASTSFLRGRAIDAPPRGAATGAGPIRDDHAETGIGG